MEENDNKSLSRYSRQRKTVVGIITIVGVKMKAGKTTIQVCRTKPVAAERKELKVTKQQYWLAKQRQWLEVYKHCQKKPEAGKTTIMVDRQLQ